MRGCVKTRITYKCSVRFSDFTEAYFYAKLGRKPTTQELDTWSTNLAKSYSTAYAESEAALAASVLNVGLFVLNRLVLLSKQP